MAASAAANVVTPQERTEPRAIRLISASGSYLDQAGLARCSKLGNFARIRGGDLKREHGGGFGVGRGGFDRKDCGSDR